MKSVEFITTGSSNALGSFSTGDIAHNIPDDLADHFVNEARCAKFYAGPAKAPAAQAAAQAPVIARPPRQRKAAAEKPATTEVPAAPAEAAATPTDATPAAASAEGAADGAATTAADQASAE